MPSQCSGSALPLAEHPAHPVCTLAGLPGRPGTPEIPQKYKNTVLVLWKPAESKAPCTYTLERRLDGMWCCLRPRGATARNVGSQRDTWPGQKCPMSWLSPVAWQNQGQGTMGSPGPWSALALP